MDIYTEFYAVWEYKDGLISASRHGHKARSSAIRESQDMKAHENIIKVACCKASNQMDAINIAADAWNKGKS